MSVRDFPRPSHDPPPCGSPYCRWCGHIIVHGRAKSRNWHDGRLDEPNCAYEFRLHTRTEDQRAYVAKRDGHACWDCKQAPGRWKRDRWPTVRYGPRDMRCFDRLDERIEYVGQFWAIEWTTALELEHTVALWSVAHLPPDQRRAYFGPENLRLRCVPCHKPKTKAEAAARAKGNRQAKMRLDVPVEKSKTPLRSRNAFPQKGQGRKMMSRPFPLRPNWK